MPALHEYDVPKFHELQLANFLIANIDSSYHAPNEPPTVLRRGSGDLGQKRVPLLDLEDDMFNSDEADGHSDSVVKLVVLHP